MPEDHNQLWEVPVQTLSPLELETPWSYPHAWLRGPQVCLIICNPLFTAHRVKDSLCSSESRRTERQSPDEKDVKYPGAGPHLTIPILGHRAWNRTTSWVLTALSWLCKETLEKPSSPNAISGSVTKKFRIFLCWCLQLDANSSLSELCLTWNLPYTDKYMLRYIRVICVPGLCFPKISSWT